MILKIQNWLICFFLLCSWTVMSQEEKPVPEIVDIVWLKDGSKLTGTIIKWEYETGMDFQLVTGAQIFIPKPDILKVMQNLPSDYETKRTREPYIRESRVYAFKEKGWYQNTSGFFNLSIQSGAGIHHAMGYRFNKFIGIGLGTGIETNDMSMRRNIIPVYAELRGFLLSKKITPYYAVKIGYGFALRDEVNGTIEAKGGIHVSPELGVRFGASDVSYYLGLEYKLQNATFVSNGWDWGGGTRITDVISYRRVELRTGLLF